MTRTTWPVDRGLIVGGLDGIRDWPPDPADWCMMVGIAGALPVLTAVLGWLLTTEGE